MSPGAASGKRAPLNAHSAPALLRGDAVRMHPVGIEPTT
jgi:hypothetical protein